ncbi:phosphopantetheine-binding protein [Flagellimonas nanhaiensis]|uniref:Acyl carrier protein n=1 Tax=Flagellimonas nanhaiensis TaxID=2292706 RepID=A0A371JKV6_9FLAO|nr:phosphopantetheine-binding protein [Allomuricauda nanhaiensis]RDY57582.1 acyl carrier protein [Allomuricauda nanhaiensis]
MEEFKNSIAEILEVDSVSLSDELESFDAWDSLAVLSIIALFDTTYNVALTAEDINNAKTISGLQELMENHQ